MSGNATREAGGGKCSGYNHTPVPCSIAACLQPHGQTATGGQLKAALPGAACALSHHQGLPGCRCSPRPGCGAGVCPPVRKCKCRSDRGVFLAAPELKSLALTSLQTPTWRSPVQDSGAGNRAVSLAKTWAGGALPFWSGMALLYCRLEIQTHPLSRAHCAFLFLQLLREGLHLFICSYSCLYFFNPFCSTISHQ